MQLILNIRKTMTILLAISMLLVVCSCTGKKDLTGKWQGKMTLPETGKSLNDLEFNLVQTGDQVGGAMIFTKVDAAKVKLTGTRTGDEVKFNSEYKRGMSMSFSGKLAGGSKIAGNAVLYYNDPKIPIKQDNVILELTR